MESNGELKPEYIIGMITREKMQEFIDTLNAKYPVVESYDRKYAFTTGKRYYKIVRATQEDKVESSYGFVDIENGDLYKAASWSAPAKHVRGNILDKSGIDACERFSVKYLI